MGKVKVISVMICVFVMVVCGICYTGYVSRTIFDIEISYPEVEGCSARMADEVPEGYFVYYYGDEEDLADMEAVEVTWQLSNIINDWIYVDHFWADYRGTDGSYLYAMEKEEEELAIPGYENKRIIPPGEQVNYTEYVLVPEGTREMEAKPGYGAAQTRDGRESFTISF